MSDSVVVDLSLDQGADFSLQLYWTDAGNNPFSVLHPMQMDIKSATGTVVHSMSTASDPDEEPDILYNSDSGLIQLHIPATVTAILAPGAYAYDLFVTYQDDAASRTYMMKLIRGTINVQGRVTEVI